MNTCATCKHWDQTAHNEGNCQAVRVLFADAMVYIHANCDLPVKARLRPSPWKYTVGGLDYEVEATLATNGDFGCVMHKPTQH